MNPPPVSTPPSKPRYSTSSQAARRGLDHRSCSSATTSRSSAPDVRPGRRALCGALWWRRGSTREDLPHNPRHPYTPVGPVCVACRAAGRRKDHGRLDTIPGLSCNAGGAQLKGLLFLPRGWRPCRRFFAAPSKAQTLSISAVAAAAAINHEQAPKPAAASRRAICLDGPMIVGPEAGTPVPAPPRTLRQDLWQRRP